MKRYKQAGSVPANEKNQVLRTKRPGGASLPRLHFRNSAALLLAMILFVLCIVPGGAVYGAGDKPELFIVTDRSIVKGKTRDIGVNDEITLKLTIKNPDVNKYTPKELVIESSSYFFGKEQNVFEIESENKETFTIELPIVYSGSGYNLLLSMNYLEKDTTPPILLPSSIKPVYIGEASPTLPEPTPSPSPSPTPTPIDTTKLVPKLAITGGNALPEADAGGTLTLNLPITNQSVYLAQHVTLKLEPGDAANIPYQPGMVSQNRSIQQFNGNETKTVSYSLSIKPDAAAGVYPLKLSGTFSNAYGDPFTYNETLYFKINNNSVPAGLSVKLASSVPAVALPGGKVLVTVRIANDGTLPAKDIKLSLTGLKSDGFATEGAGGTRRIARISGGMMAEEQFALTVSPVIPGGSQPLGIKWEYKDAGGNPVSEETQVFITVKQAEEVQSAVILESLTAPTGVLLPGEKFDVSFKVNNTGNAKAQNVKVSVTADKELIPVTLSNVILPSLEAGKSKNLSFSFKVAPDATTKSYPISIVVEYDVMQAGQPAKASLTQYAGVYIQGKETPAPGEENKSVPRIIVNRYSLEPAEAMAGEDTALAVTLLNTSSLLNVRNIKLTVSSDDGIFTVDGSNTFFIDSIPTKAAVDQSFTLRAKPDAEPKMYALSLNLEYEDDKGNPFTSKETVSVPVVQTNRLTVGEIGVLGMAFPMQPVPLSAEFYNMGKSTLYNLMVTIEGDFQSSGGTYYVGNFAPGRSDSFSPAITPAQGGQLTGDIVFSFEDAAGHPNEIRKPFSVDVTEMPPMEEYPLEPPMEDPGTSSKWGTYLMIGIPALLIAAGIAAILVVKIKRRKRKELELDDDF